MLCTGEKLYETLISWHLQTHCSASRDPKWMGYPIWSYGNRASTPHTLSSSLPTSTWITFYNSSSFHATWIWCFNALWTASIGWKCPPCGHPNKSSDLLAPSTPALCHTTCRPLYHGNAIRFHDARISKMARAYINLSFRPTFRHLQISTEGYQSKQKEVSAYKWFQLQSVAARIWWLPCHSHDPPNTSTCSDSLPYSWTMENSLEFISGERHWQSSHRPFEGYSFGGGRP